MSAIDEMAGLAADAIENTRIGKELAKVALNRDEVEAILARHSREGVRELVLAAREVDDYQASGDDGQAYCGHCGATPASRVRHYAGCKLGRLRKALEGFTDVE